MDSERWYVLGFTADDVVTAEQDARLAQECERARAAAGRPDGFIVLQSSGEGPHFIYWYVPAATAVWLDAAEVPWRQFIIAERTTAPAHASQALPKV